MPPPTDRIRLLEDIGADAWPPATTAWLAGWRLGLDGGVTRRANSVRRTRHARSATSMR